MSRIVAIEADGDTPVKVTQTFRSLTGGTTFEQECVVAPGRAARFAFYPGVESISVRAVETAPEPPGVKQPGSSSGS